MSAPAMACPPAPPPPNWRRAILRAALAVWWVLCMLRLACRDLVRAATELVSVNRAIRRGWLKALRLCWRRAVLHLAARRRLARCRDCGPLVDDLGYPTACHPEDVLRELPGRDKEWLAGLAAVLWPAGEYAEILRCYSPDSGRGGAQW